MGHELTRRDRERFEAIKRRLAGVKPAESAVESQHLGPGPIDPMLATSFSGDLGDVDEEAFIAEQKFDGTRLILEKFDGEVSLYTRRHVERSETLPALSATAEASLPDGTILDGEYTFLTADGVSHFTPIHTTDGTISERELDGSFFVFDVLAAAGEWTTRRAYDERRAILEEAIPFERPLALVEPRYGAFEAFYDELVDAGEEGIILKRRTSQYHIGTRSSHWRKVKAFNEVDVVIVGYTDGQGRRSSTFGSLVMTDGDRYVGKVGSGFSESELETISKQLNPTDEWRVSAGEVGSSYTPIEPFVAQVKYQAVTPSGTLRAPVFLRLRPDKPIEDVTQIDGGSVR